MQKLSSLPTIALIGVTGGASEGARIQCRLPYALRPAVLKGATNLGQVLWKRAKGAPSLSEASDQVIAERRQQVEDCAERIDAQSH